MNENLNNILFDIIISIKDKNFQILIVEQLI